ncbi:MAG: cobalt transporter CbiM [Planctomycetes bacterium]|nr:cobalt transporter CbiM [Planctomycetota bacterium]
MHIPDNLLDPPVWLGGYAAAGVAVKLSLRRFRPERIPEIGVMTGLFFVATTIQFPLVGTSVHLLLNALMGVLLGWASIPAILVAVSLQAVLLGEGGITTIGVLTCVLGSGALASAALFHSLRGRAVSRARLAGLGAACTLAAFASSGALYVLVLATAGKEIRDLAWFAVVLHLPVAAIEIIVTASVIVFLSRVLPDALDPQASRAEAHPARQTP